MSKTRSIQETCSKGTKDMSYTNTAALSNSKDKCHDPLYYRFIKRAFDITASGLMLVIASPVMAGVAIAIKAEDGGPLIYTSTRIGSGMKEIDIYKFRSMHVGAEHHLESLREFNDMGEGPRFKLKNDPRVTKTGKFIRKYSLDELPQLWNVFKGDVSLIGPRPHSIYEVEQYDDYALQRFNVKSGVLCYSECCGRSDLLFKESIDYDIKYLEKHGLLVDAKIILLAAKAVLTGKGAK